MGSTEPNPFSIDPRTVVPRQPNELPVPPVEPTANAEPLLQFFTYMHLPAHLQNVSKPFAELALHIVSALPRNPERTVALRKLLESKDCAVRAMLYK